MSVFISVFLCSCAKDVKNFYEEQGENFYTCQYKNTNRKFRLYLPETQDLRKSSLIVMLHGYGESAESFSRQTQFEKSALPKNYAVLYITGIPNPSVKTSSAGWNYFYDSNGKKDIGFIVDLTKFIQKKYKLGDDAYVVGFSNGAFMTTKLAVEYSSVYRGFVSVGGMMPKTVWEHKKKNYKQPVRFFQINGTKDNVTPMRLNNSDKTNPNPAIEDVLDYFVESNKIKNPGSVEKINERVTITRYENKVWWMLIEDFSHSWPDGSYANIDANKYILEFLEFF